MQYFKYVDTDFDEQIVEETTVRLDLPIERLGCYFSPRYRSPGDLMKNNASSARTTQESYSRHYFKSYTTNPKIQQKLLSSSEELIEEKDN